MQNTKNVVVLFTYLRLEKNEKVRDMIGLDGPCGEHGGGIKLSFEHSQQQNIKYFRNNLRGRIQGKNNDFSLLFLEISKLEYLANACSCRDLSSDCNLQVSEQQTGLGPVNSGSWSNPF